jgi:hypothetical protein
VLQSRVSLFHQAKIDTLELLNSSPRNKDSQDCTNKHPSPWAGRDDSTATTAFAQISDQAPYYSSNSCTEDIFNHGLDLSLIAAPYYLRSQLISF